MKKNFFVLVLAALIIIVGALVFKLFFDSTNYELVYSNIVTIDNSETDIYNEFIKNNYFIINSKEELKDFDMKYFNGNQLDNLKYNGKSIIIVYKLIDGNSQNIYSIENVQIKNSSLTITANISGSHSNFEGFEDSKIIYLNAIELDTKSKLNSVKFLVNK